MAKDEIPPLFDPTIIKNAIVAQDNGPYKKKNKPTKVNPHRGAYDRMIREQFGDKMVDKANAAAAASSAAAGQQSGKLPISGYANLHIMNSAGVPLVSAEQAQSVLGKNVTEQAISKKPHLQMLIIHSGVNLKDLPKPSKSPCCKPPQPSHFLMTEVKLTGVPGGLFACAGCIQDWLKKHYGEYLDYVGKVQIGKTVDFLLE